MRHQHAGRKLSRKTAHRISLLRTAVTDLLRHELIQTTEPKAREIRRAAEKIITRGKVGTLHARRKTAAFLTDEDMVRKVFSDLATRYEERPGGYTRIIKIGPRKGDAAPMAVIELLP